MSVLKCIPLLLLPVALLGPGAVSEKAPVKPARWLVQKSSNLRIQGSTNINKFCCHVNQYDRPDTLTLCRADEKACPAAMPLKGELCIDIENFDCSSRPMTKEFKKILQSSRYPRLRIVFLDIEKMPAFGQTTECLKGNVAVELAGVYKKFSIDYTVSGRGEGAFDLVGERTFSFSDFCLVPPVKMGGLVRVNDQLHVVFKLDCRNLE